MRTLVLMFCGPHYGGKVHYGRINRAIAAAKHHEAPLLIAGDANNGEDVSLFHAWATFHDVKQVIPLTGGWHTRGDARQSACAIAEMDGIDEIRIVTDWYHLPRASLALRQELERLGITEIPLRWVPVWQHFLGVLPQLPHEVCGVVDYLRGRPQRSRGTPFHKPRSHHSRV